jgi:hypothetical protein
MSHASKKHPQTVAAVEPAAPGVLTSGAFGGRREFQQLVRDAFVAAEREGWKEIILCDANFVDWPLGERVVVDALNAWAAPGRRRITLLARRFDEVISHHPRFVRWRTTWSHIVEARACRTADPLELPSAIWTPEWVLNRLDPIRCRGITGREADRRVALNDELHEWLKQSTPSFPATTLGL